MCDIDQKIYQYFQGFYLHLDAFTHYLMQDMNAFNLQLQMH